MDDNQPTQSDLQTPPPSEPTVTPPSPPEPVVPSPPPVETPTEPVLNREEAMKLVSQPPPTDANANNTSQSSGSGLFNAASAVFFGILNWFIIPIIIVFVLHNFVFQAFHVVGSSMVPTLHDMDYIIVSKVGKTVSGFEHKSYIPHRYDVVVFHYPKDPSLIFVKRVIGLPGEHIVVKDGHVTIYNSQNAQGLNPDTSLYQRAAETTQGSFDDIVPQGSIFVLGDNRTPSGSFDSRDWGFLPSSYIVGTAYIRLLPLDQFRLFSIIPTEIPALAKNLFGS